MCACGCNKACACIRARARARVCVCLRAFSVSCPAVMCVRVFIFLYSGYVECYNGPTTRRAATWRPRSRQRGCSLQPSCRGLLPHSPSHGTTATFYPGPSSRCPKRNPRKDAHLDVSVGIFAPSTKRGESSMQSTITCQRRPAAHHGGGSGAQPHDRAVGTLRAPNISRLGLRRLA